MRGWRVAIGALAIAGGAALAWWATRPATRFVYGVVAAGPGEGLLLTRRNEDRSTRFWIESVDAAGALRWSAELTPVAPEESLGFSSAAADDTRVIVFGHGPEGDVAQAFERATGRRLWRTELSPTLDTRIGPSVVFDGPRVVFVRTVRGPAGLRLALQALQADSGERAWAQDLAGDGDVRRIAPDRLLVTSRGEQARLLDGATGAELSRTDIRWAPCPLATGVLASARRSLVILSADAPRELPHDPRWRAADGPCGERDGDVIVGGRLDDDTAVVLRLDPRTGVERWRAGLGSVQLEPVLTLDGRLPRFVPVASFAFGGEAAALAEELAVLDLDTGAVVRRAHRQEHVQVLTTDTRAYVWAQFSATLVGLDPATGATATATSFTGISSGDLRRDDVHAGGLWLYGMGWAPPDALPWAHVDLADGRVVRTSGEVAARPSDAAARLGG